MASVSVVTIEKRQMQDCPAKGNRMQTAKISSFIDTGRNDAEKLDKLLDLEAPIRDLKDMSNILLTLIEALAPQANKGGPEGRVALDLSRDQWDAIDFAAARISGMARGANQAFLDAYSAGA
jgi:hypothetical protein